MSGTLYDPSGAPIPNAVITFNSVQTQIIGSETIAPTVVSTTTNASGVLTSINLAQGLVVQININSSAPYSAIVPYTTAVSFSALATSVLTSPATSVTTETVTFNERTAPALSSAGQTLLYMDSTTDRLRASMNAGAYSDVLTAASVDTLSNKTFNANVTGNVLKVNSSVAITALSGNTATLATTSGALPSGNCAKFDASGNIADSGVGCGSGAIGGTGTTDFIPKWTSGAAIGNSLASQTSAGLDIGQPLVLTEQAAPGLSAAGKANVYADSTAHNVQVSINAGAYTPMAVISGATVTDHLAKFNASGQLVDAGLAISKFAMMNTSPDASQTATQYMPPQGRASGGATSEAQVNAPSPFAGTLKNLYCKSSTAPGAGNSWTFTYRKNAASTALTCAISGASATTCNDTVNNFSVVAADLLALQIVPTSTPVAGALSCGVEFSPS